MKLFLLFSLALISCCLAEPSEIGDASSCVSKIVKNFYTYRSKVTFVDIKFRHGDDVLKALSSLYHVGIVTRTTVNLNISQSDGYIVAVGNTFEFLYKFLYLEREPEWNPKRRFIIIIDKLAQQDLHAVFNTLLRLCIYNAIVIDNTRNPIIYTYNPFENYACGKGFDRIIEMGSCLNSSNDIYFEKFITGLKNCTFITISAHWPPYSIDPAIKKSRPGVEEFIIKLIGEWEQFNIVHYNYSNDAENFSVVSKNMSLSGPLVVIQEKKGDMMFGGMLLTKSRASAFDFIWEHLPYVDDIRILVKAATYVNPWRNSYLEFSSAVWVILLSALFAYYALMLLLLRSNDKSMLFIKMCDYFFQHGSKIPSSCNIKCVFIFWIWFAYLMSSIYQSSLVGLITNPSRNYQIANEKDIEKFNLRPCVSPSMVKFFYSVQEDLFLDDHTYFDKCDSLLTSIKSVSKSENLYTYTLYAVYSYYKYSFYDDYGMSDIYAFQYPTNKVIYAIYMYKGFPMSERLQNLSLRLRENGITTNYFANLLHEQKKDFKFKKRQRKAEFVVPWYILIIGSAISTLVFIIELNKKPKVERRQ